MKHLSLKLAIVAARRTQREVSQRTGIPECRLSDIIHGKAEATSDERAKLARTLRKRIAELFAAEQAVA